MGLSIAHGIGIPFKKNSFSWNRYWATLISATVENANPNKLILTFGKANTSLVAADFSVNFGHTVTLLERDVTNKIFTLTLSPAVFVFEKNLIVTFLKSGGTANITNNVADDGNTAMWLNTDDISKLVINGDTRVTEWIDKLSTRKLTNGNSSPVFPKYNSPYLSGEGNAWLYITNATGVGTGWELPCSVYMILRLKTWASEDIISAGASGGMNAIVIKQNPTTPKIEFYNGSTVGNRDLTLNQWKVISIRVAADGTFSLQVTDDTELTGNCGTTKPVGFSLFARTDGYARSDVDVFEVILRKDADATKGNLIKEYMKNRIGFFLT